MAIVGWIAVLLVIAVVLVGLALVLRSIPDIRRYLAIRKM
ncbi:MAG: hypothetical protein QOI06_3290 [Nocardioidaceae bacterium]|jgi:hypothetical protein|nr:hypothetical protein [Nocardioidaceae bacterium]